MGINFLIVLSRDDATWCDSNGNGNSNISSNNSTNINNLYYDGAALRDYLILWDFLRTYISIFDVYNVNNYLAALGLGVAKKYRKRGIATHMLRARYVLFIFLFWRIILVFENILFD